ncbi:MAG TPA: protein-glutamate O-methyltransferase CheR [Polyangia bacterium]|jgi:Methylase of chemotaxis methyl-accepting proteins|nr:protein-glutamate O-methyltransferase CheR [Polyangia bacterium]
MNGQFAEEEWKLLLDLVSREFGLVFQDSRRRHLESRLVPRLRALGLESFGAYYRYLARHPEGGAELRELAGIVTNNETYFFREAHHFDLLVQHVVPQLSMQGRSGSLRVLSAGCSSGDEAYSIVIALQGALLDRAGWDWQVDACDLNPARITQAREGLYEAGSLRACDELGRGAHFSAQGERFRLRAEHRRGTSFFEANLAVAGLKLPGAPYHVIFCRNVLIYFSEEAFHRTLSHFHRTLAAGGYLFLGHAESLIGRRNDFQPVRLSNSIVYRKQDAIP